MIEYATEWTQKDLDNGFTYQWNPDDVDGPTLKITKSSLGTFNFCNGSYRYSYDPFDEGKKPQKTSEAMLRGTIVHNAQEDFWKMVDTEKAMPFIDDSNKLVKHFRDYYPEGEDEDTKDLYRALSAWQAERFIECVHEGTVEHFVPIGNEIILNATIRIGGINIHLQGIIDRMFFDDDGYIPFELKTGLWKDSKKTNMRKEMAFYQLLYENADEEELIKMGLDPQYNITHWGWIFPKSNYIFVEETKARSMTSVMNSIQKLVDAYMLKEFPFSYFHKKCVHCGHFEHCEATGGGTNYDWF